MVLIKHSLFNLTMFSIIKKIITAILGVIFLLFASTAILLYSYRDWLKDELMKSLNEGQEGHFVCEKIQIDPFSNFPYVSIDLKHLHFYPTEDETVQPIYAFHDVYIGFDAPTLLRGEFTIKKINISGGELNLVTDSTGSFNLLSAKARLESSSDTVSSPMHLDLQKIELHNIAIRKDDQVKNAVYHIQLNDAAIRFSFIQDLIDSHLDLDMLVHEISVDGITYAKNKHTSFDVDFTYDIAKEALDLKPSSIQIENADFDLGGFFHMQDDAHLNLKIHGQKDDFSLLIALAPEEVQKAVELYRNEGKIYFDGTIEGHLAQEAPAIALEFGCENAWFRNMDTSKTLEDLNFKGYFTNGTMRSLETFELKIENLRGKPEQSIFQGSLHIKNFVDPFINLDLTTNLDLASLQKFVPLEGVKSIEGNLTLNLKLDEFTSSESGEDLQGQFAYLKERGNGGIKVSNLRFLHEDYPHEIRDLNADIRMQKGKILIEQLKGRVKDSDFNLKGEIMNLIPFLHKKEGQIEVAFGLDSKVLNVSQLSAQPAVDSTHTDKVFSNLHFDAKAVIPNHYLYSLQQIPFSWLQINNLNFSMSGYPHAFHDFNLQVSHVNKNLIVKELKGAIDKSHFQFACNIENMDAIFEPAASLPLVWDCEFHSDELIFSDLLTYQGQNYLPEEYQKEVIKNLDFSLHFRADSKAIREFEGIPDFNLKIHRLNGLFSFHPLKIKNVSGEVYAKNKDLFLQGFDVKIGSTNLQASGKFLHFFDTLQEGKIYLNVQSERLNLDELLAYDEKQELHGTAHDSVYNIFAVPFPNMEISANIGHLHYHKYLVDDLYAKLRILPNHYIYLDTVALKAAEGRFGITGYFNGSNPDKIYMKSKIQVEKARLEKIFFKLDNFGQDMLVSDNIQGSFTGRIESLVRMHTDLTPDLGETEASIQMTIEDGIILNFAPFQLMADFMSNKNLNRVRFGKLANQLTFKNGEVRIPKMQINSTLGYMHLEGSQKMDLTMAYTMFIPTNLIAKATFSMLTKGFRKKDGKANFDPEREDKVVSDETRVFRTYLPVRIVGNPDNFEIKLGKKESINEERLEKDRAKLGA